MPKTKARPRSEQIYVAIDSFTTDLPDGTPVFVYKDTTRVREGHALLKGREHLFKPIDVEYDVEQATAAPGEKRGA